jgi:hypothetical protein
VEKLLLRKYSWNPTRRARMTRKFPLNFRGGEVLVEFVGRMWDCFSMVVVVVEVVDEREALASSLQHRRVCMRYACANIEDGSK